MVGLNEVLFAVLAAWLAFGQRSGPVQLIAGAVMLAGIVLVQLGGRPIAAPAVAEPGPTGGG